METRIINYGESREVTVESVDKAFIICIGKKDNEGYVLIGHGLSTLPKPGDNGKIVFERDKRKGHWQYYPQAP